MIQRKSGKTPGRERKHVMHTKRSNKSNYNMKEDEYPMNSILTHQSYSTVSNNNVWDENRASFSYVVAQKPINPIINPDPAVPLCINENKKRFKCNSSHPIRQCLSNKFKSMSPDRLEGDDEKYFDDNNDIKRKSMDLGPIGTRKSPSSTPIWEPMVPAVLKKPTPLSSSCLNSNSFNSFNNVTNSQPFSNFGFDLMGNAQFFSSSNALCNSGINQHHITQKQHTQQTNQQYNQQQQQQQAWDNTLLPFYQGDTETLLNSWGANKLWAPVDYNSPPSNTGWPTSTIRPPPGLTLKDRNRDIDQQLKQQQEQQRNNIPQFDPFNSFQSFWSQESWINDNNNINNSKDSPKSNNQN